MAAVIDAVMIKAHAGCVTGVAVAVVVVVVHFFISSFRVAVASVACVVSRFMSRSLGATADGHCVFLIGVYLF